MEMTQYSKPNRDGLLSISAGVVFVYLAIYVIGIGSAVAVPESLLLPLAEVSPTFAFSVVDLVTVGVPIAICFFVYAWLLKRATNKVNHYFLAAPFVLFMLYSLIEAAFTGDYFVFNASKIIIKTLPLIGCVILLTKNNNSGRSA